MPNNIRFSEKYSEGIKQLQEILKAFCVHNPGIGYCQGMNFIVGIALLFLEPEDAFWCLVAVTEKLFLSNYFDNGLTGAQADQQCLKEIVKHKIPELSQHLENIDVDLSSITLNWFLAVFIDTLPFETLLRVWDCFLLEGSKCLFRFSCALLKTNKDLLIEQTDTISLYKNLKHAVKSTYDVDGLIRSSYEELKPFPRRKDLSIRQAYYSKILAETWRLRQVEKKNFTQQESLMNQILDNGQNLNKLLECATFLDNDFFWVCFGGQTEGNILTGHLNSRQVKLLELKTDSKILSILSIPSLEVVFIGLLSKQMIAIDFKNNKILWNKQFSDSVQSMIYVSNKVYCGLNDGVLVVFELNSIEEPTDIYTIQISNWPIRCIEKVLNKEDTCSIWLSSRNTIHILNEQTLSNFKNIEVCSNQSQYNQISQIKWCPPHGVWLALKGSQFLYFYDHSNYQLKFVFDPKLNQIEHSLKDEELNSNQSRVTSVLTLKDTLWIGTSDGYLTIFTIHKKETNSLKKSTSEQFMNTSLMNTESSNKELTNNETSSTLNEDWHSALDTFKNSSNNLSSSSPSPTSTRKLNKKSTRRNLLSMKKHLYKIAYDLNSLRAEDLSLSRLSVSDDLSFKLSSCSLSEMWPKKENDEDEEGVSNGQTSDDTTLVTDVEDLLSFLNKSNVNKHSSFCVSSDDLNDFEIILELECKARLSDKPIRCLLSTIQNEQDVVISCSGNLGEEESILKWTRSNKDKNWTNIPFDTRMK